MILIFAADETCDYSISFCFSKATYILMPSYIICELIVLYIRNIWSKVPKKFLEKICDSFQSSVLKKREGIDLKPIFRVHFYRMLTFWDPKKCRCEYVCVFVIHSILESTYTSVCKYTSRRDQLFLKFFLHRYSLIIYTENNKNLFRSHGNIYVYICQISM